MYYAVVNPWVDGTGKCRYERAFYWNYPCAHKCSGGTTDNVPKDTERKQEFKVKTNVHVCDIYFHKLRNLRNEKAKYIIAYHYVNGAALEFKADISQTSKKIIYLLIETQLSTLNVLTLMY